MMMKLFMNKPLLSRVLVCCLLSALVLMPDAAHAAIYNFADALCSIVCAITGRIGKALATLAVIIIGIAAFFGKVNWGLALMVAVGIAALFGAATIVQIISGSGDPICPACGA